mgnify:FL=1
MHKIISLIAVLIHSISFSQNPTTRFDGIFETTTQETSYKKFHFNNRGHVMINDSIAGVFIKEKNKIYIVSNTGFYFLFG